MSRTATTDASTAALQREWERVRRQRMALEEPQKHHHERDDAQGDPTRDESEEATTTTEELAALVMAAPRTTDPFACCCRPFKLQKIGQSYVLRDRRVVDRRRVARELVLVGPHWVGVLVTLSIVVGCTALFLHQQCALLPWYYSVVTLGFCGMTLYYLYCVACLDPGIVFPAANKANTLKKADHVVPDNDDRTTIVVEDDDCHEEDHNDDSHDEDALESGAGARVRGTTARPATGPAPSNTWVPPPSYYSRFSPRARFCDICEVPQDAYTEHCEDCGVCIEDYDHHCPWMGKCIGKKNMYAFKMFNVSWVFYVIFVLFVSIQNVDWGDAAVQRLHRLSTGEWVPLGTTEKPH